MRKRGIGIAELGLRNWDLGLRNGELETTDREQAQVLGVRRQGRQPATPLWFEHFNCPFRAQVECYATQSKAVSRSFLRNVRVIKKRLPPHSKVLRLFKDPQFEIPRFALRIWD
jgi:hypothetical protein